MADVNAMQPFLSAHHISTNLDNYEYARSGFFTLLVGSDKSWNDTDPTSYDTINKFLSSNWVSNISLISADTVIPLLFARVL